MYTLRGSGHHVLSVAYECRWLTLYFTARLGGLTQAYVGGVMKDLRVHAACNMKDSLRCLEAAAEKGKILRNIAIGVGRQNTHVHETASLTDQ